MQQKPNLLSFLCILPFYRCCVKKSTSCTLVCSFNVNGTFMKTFHWFYHISPHTLLCWNGSLTLSNRNRLQGIVDVSCTIAGTTLNDLTHQFKLLPSGRGYNLPKCRTNGLQFSLVPAAISLLNNVIFMYLLFIFLSDIYLVVILLAITNCPKRIIKIPWAWCIHYPQCNSTTDSSENINKNINKNRTQSFVNKQKSVVHFGGTFGVSVFWFLPFFLLGSLNLQ